MLSLVPPISIFILVIQAHTILMIFMFVWVNLKHENIKG